MRSLRLTFERPTHAHRCSVFGTDGFRGGTSNCGAAFGSSATASDGGGQLPAPLLRLALPATLGATRINELR